MIAIVECPRCCHEQEYDTEYDDRVLCDTCTELIRILEDDAIIANTQMAENEEEQEE